MTSVASAICAGLIINGWIIDEWIERRSGSYNAYHQLSVTESNGLYYGYSFISRGYESFGTWYGMEMATSSNLDLRGDGWPTAEQAGLDLARRFGIIGVAGGKPVFKGGRKSV